MESSRKLRGRLIEKHNTTTTLTKNDSSNEEDCTSFSIPLELRTMAHKRKRTRVDIMSRKRKKDTLIQSSSSDLSEESRSFETQPELSTSISTDELPQSVPIELPESISYNVEHKLLQGYKDIDFVIGVDEVGRGCLAGPLVVCACYIPRNLIGNLRGIKDSKLLNETTREQVYASLVQKKEIQFKLAQRSPDVIDRSNILAAVLDAMNSASQLLIQQLSLQMSTNSCKCLILIDGNKIPVELQKLSDQSIMRMNCQLTIYCESIVKGDAKMLSIAAASIIAKVTRDRLLNQSDAQFPFYGFKEHKGYATQQHIQAIRRYGVLDFHRLTYRPICDLILSGKINWPCNREKIDIDPKTRRKAAKERRQEEKK